MFAQCWCIVANENSQVTLTRAGFAVHSEPLARLPLVGFGAGAVEVVLHAVARGLVLAGVRLARVRGRPAGDLRWPEGEGGFRRVAITTLQVDQLEQLGVILPFGDRLTSWKLKLVQNDAEHRQQMKLNMAVNTESSFLWSQQ